MADEEEARVVEENELEDSEPVETIINRIELKSRQVDWLLKSYAPSSLYTTRVKNLSLVLCQHDLVACPLIWKCSMIGQSVESIDYFMCCFHPCSGMGGKHC
jgi:hypothetical protein